MGQTQSQLIQEPFWGGWWRRRRARRRRRRARRRRRLPRHNVRIGNWTNYVKKMQANRLKNPLLWFLILLAKFNSPQFSIFTTFPEDLLIISLYFS